MEVFHRNIIANYFGKAWISVIGILFIPIYIDLLGIESLGVIGFYGSLLSLFSFLDLGISQTLVREAARTNLSVTNKMEFSKLVGTLECIYFFLALILITTLALLSDWASETWLSSESISNKYLSNTVTVMGLVATIAWAKELYRSVLIGQQRQVWLNIIDSCFSTIRIIGVIGFLIILGPTLKVFFVFQGVVSLIELLLLRISTWREIETKLYLPKFHWNQLKRIWKFSSGVALVSITGSCISQLDKLLLPGLVTLKEFGYYTIAQLLGRALTQLTSAVPMAFRPIFSQHVARNMDCLLRQDYRKASQLMAISIVPASIVLATFSPEILLLWTNSLEVSNKAASTMSLLALGTMLNGLVNIPYSVQLAYGWLSAAMKTNFIFAMVLLPVFILSVDMHGIAGAGWVWFFMNLGYVSINVLLLHKRYLLGGWKDWYFRDNFPVILCAGMSAVFFNILMKDISLNYVYAVLLAVASAVILLISIISLSYPRQLLFITIQRVYARTKS